MFNLRLLPYTALTSDFWFANNYYFSSEHLDVFSPLARPISTPLLKLLAEWRNYGYEMGIIMMLFTE